MNIGLTIKLERERQGLSLRQLSKLSGIPNSTISFWERGKNVPNIYQTDKLFRALGILITIGREGGEYERTR